MYAYIYIYINAYKHISALYVYMCKLTNNSFRMTAAKGPEAHCPVAPSVERHHNSYHSG